MHFRIRLFSSRLVRRRFHSFKKNKRAWYSVQIFCALILFLSSLNFFCREAPYIIWTPQKTYVPFLFSYTDQELGGTFSLEADYQDQELLALIKKRGGSIFWAPVPYGPETVGVGDCPLEAPSFKHWLGTDDCGRDVFVRLVYGMRTSLKFSILLGFFSIVLGIFFGGLQGYFGGWVDLLGQRFIELWSSLPTLFVLMILSSFVTPQLFWLLSLMIFFSWMNLAAFVRVEFLRTRSYDYVRAAQILGASSGRILWRHVLPNSLVATVTKIPFLVNYGITVLASLDFLGFGLPVGTPSLGELIRQAKNNLFAPWLAAASFFGLMFILVLVTFIGEGLRDAMDARKEEV